MLVSLLPTLITSIAAKSRYSNQCWTTELAKRCGRDRDLADEGPHKSSEQRREDKKAGGASEQFDAEGAAELQDVPDHGVPLGWHCQTRINYRSQEVCDGHHSSSGRSVATSSLMCADPNMAKITKATPAGIAAARESTSSR